MVPRTAVAALRSIRARSFCPSVSAFSAAPLTANDAAASSCTTPSCRVAAIRLRSAVDASTACSSSATRWSCTALTRSSRRQMIGSMRTSSSRRLVTVMPAKPRQSAPVRAATVS